MLQMLKERSLAALTALCLLMLAGQASAASPVLDRVVKQGVVKVGMSANQPPFNARSREGKMIGLEVDLANTLAAMLRVELEIVEKPFGELLNALEKGEVDMVMSGMAITGERGRKATFVGPYMLSGKSILTKSSTLAAAREAGEINKSNVRLAALDNSTSQEFVEKVLPQAQLTKVKNYDEGVGMVLDDKVDALVADMPICVLSVLRYPDAGLATLTRPMTVEPIGIAVSAKDPQFSNIIDNYVDALEKTGTLNQLRAKWLEDGSWIAALP